MRDIKRYWLGAVVLVVVALAWIQDFKADGYVQLGQLNVMVNEVEDILAKGGANLQDRLSALGTQRIKLRLLVPGEVFTVVQLFGRGALETKFRAEDVRDGLYTYRGADFYVVTLKGGQRLAFYGPTPAISQLHHSGLALSTVALSALLLVLYGLVWLDERRLKSFKERLLLLLGSEERPHLVEANSQRTYRYVMNRFTDYAQELVEQQYSHQLENTKQDERMRNMMHDMKTPIAALHAFTEAYEDGLYSTAMLEQKMPLVVRNVNHLLHLTDQYDNFLKYASWTTKANMRRHPVSLLVQDVLLGVERDFAIIGRKMQLVVMESPNYIVCDLNEIKKLLHILVENAHKYSEMDKPIILSAVVRANMFYITVKDYGIGIAPELHSVVFDPFVKVDKARGASAKSYGIGLYIARQIALSHGGDIQLESSLGKGSSFTLLLPLVEG